MLLSCFRKRMSDLDGMLHHHWHDGAVIVTVHNVAELLESLAKIL